MTESSDVYLLHVDYSILNSNWLGRYYTSYHNSLVGIFCLFLKKPHFLQITFKFVREDALRRNHFSLKGKRSEEPQSL